jgi:hypothetical protein
MSYLGLGFGLCVVFGYGWVGLRSRIRVRVMGVGLHRQGIPNPVYFLMLTIIFKDMASRTNEDNACTYQDELSAELNDGDDGSLRSLPTYV